MSKTMSTARKKFYQAVGRAVALRREAAGMNQKEFAGILGFSNSHVCTMERGGTQFSFFEGIVLAKYFGLNLERLVAVLETPEVQDRLREFAAGQAAELDTDIAAIEERLKILKERKAMASRVVAHAS